MGQQGPYHELESTAVCAQPAGLSHAIVSFSAQITSTNLY